MSTLISPHGAQQLNPLFVDNKDQRTELVKQAGSMPAVLVSSATAANAVMLGGGYFTPLDGFMNKADAVSVAESMSMTDGLFWPTPVLNLVDADSAVDLKAGDQIALKDPNVDGNPVLAVQTVAAIEHYTDAELVTIAEHVYGTTDREHPGVAEFMAQGTVSIAGPIQVFKRATRCIGRMKSCVEWRWKDSMQTDWSFTCCWAN